MKRVNFGVLPLITLLGAMAIGIALHFGSKRERDIDKSPSNEIVIALAPATPASTKVYLLVPPQKWIDPLEYNEGMNPALVHEDPPILPTDMKEEVAISNVESCWKWLVEHPPTETEYMRKALELRHIAMEAANRWPNGMNTSRFLYLTIRTGELFEPRETESDELWAYAKVEAAQQNIKPQTIALREINRLRIIKLHGHIIRYCNSIINHEPTSSEAYEAHYLSAESLKHWPEWQTAARQEYLESAKSSTEKVHVRGIWGAFLLALSRASYKDIVSDAARLLEDATLTQQDKAIILCEEMRAYYELKEYDQALKIAQTIEKEYSLMTQANDAVRFRKLIEASIFGK